MINIKNTFFSNLYIKASLTNTLFVTISSRVHITTCLKKDHENNKNCETDFKNDFINFDWINWTV